METGEISAGKTLSSQISGVRSTNLGGKLSLTSSPMLILTSTSPMLPEATASCRLRDMRKTEDSVNARGRRKALLLPAVRLEHLRYSGLSYLTRNN